MEVLIVSLSGVIQMMRRQQNHFAIATGLALSILASTALGDNTNQGAPSMAQAIRVRDQATRSVVYKWRCKEVRPEVGAVSPFGNEQPADAKLAINTYERSLELDGDLVRLEDSAPQWDLDRRRFLQSQITKVVNQSASKSLSRLEMPAGATIQGMISPRDKGVQALRTRFDLLPVLEHFRPHWRLEPLLAGVKSEAEKGFIGNHACTIYRTRRDNSTGVRTVSYWCDAARDYLILRVVHEVNGKVVIQEDREYQELKEHGWIPSRWKTMEFSDDGTMRGYVDAEVISAKLNEPIPADRFDLTFPNGTIIVDSTRKTQSFGVIPGGAR